MKEAIFDDYQNVALTMVDWSHVESKAEITVFTDRVGEPDAVVGRLPALAVTKCFSSASDSPKDFTVGESRSDTRIGGELRRVLTTLEGLIVAVVDGASGGDPGRRRADDHHHRGGGEHYDQPGVERPRDQLREEFFSGQHGRVDSWLIEDSGGAKQFGDRVVTQERREQAFGRRQIGSGVGHSRGYALLLQPGAERGGQRVGQAGDHQ